MKTEDRNWYDGKRCLKCQGTQRYVATGRCVACRRATNRAITAKRRTLHDDGRLGLASGFVQFATTQCAILRWVHDHRPCLGWEVAQALKLKRGVVSMALRQLVDTGFLYRRGRARCAPGARSAVLFTTDPRERVVDRTKPLTGSERTAAYRQRKRLKAPSVFAFRGTLSVTGK